MLARRFDGPFTVVMLASGHFSGRRELLQAICTNSKCPIAAWMTANCDWHFSNVCLLISIGPRACCCWSNEAQRLPPRLLEELRLLGDYAVDGQPRVRLIMAGNRNLEDHLANPKLDGLAQRVAVRSYVAPLERGETAAYVRSQIAALGGHSESVFTPEALDAIHQATDGIPRLINQLSDHALVLAFAAGRRQVDRSRVEEAWSDLQQLPAPWNDADVETSDGSANVIEFGELGDEDEPEALPFVMDSMLTDEPSPAVKLDRITAQLASLDDEFDMPEPTEPLAPRCIAIRLPRVSWKRKSCSTAMRWPTRRWPPIPWLAARKARCLVRCWSRTCILAGSRRKRWPAQ